MQPFLAMITPVASGGRPDQGLPQPPVGIWPGPNPPYLDIGFPLPQPPGGGHLSHPWVPPSPGYPSHPWVPPQAGSPSHPWVPPVGIWPSPGHPAHPIAPGGMPPYPDHGLPGQPPYVDNALPPYVDNTLPPSGRPPTPGNSAGALVIAVPATDPPTPPPAGIPAGSTQVLIWFGPGTKAASAWVAPYVSAAPPQGAGEVPPPTATPQA